MPGLRDVINIDLDRFLAATKDNLITLMRIFLSSEVQRNRSKRSHLVVTRQTSHAMNNHGIECYGECSDSGGASVTVPSPGRIKPETVREMLASLPYTPSEIRPLHGTQVCPAKMDTTMQPCLQPPSSKTGAHIVRSDSRTELLHSEQLLLHNGRRQSQATGPLPRTLQSEVLNRN